MTKSKQSKSGDGNKGGAARSTIIAALVVAVSSSGIGILSGVQLRKVNSASERPATLAVARTAPGEFQVLTLPSLVTNLSAGGWIRLEMAVLVDGRNPVQQDLAARLAQDTTALLRTISARQLSGPSGFLHLREELLDRMKARSSGRVRDIMIQSLVIE